MPILFEAPDDGDLLGFGQHADFFEHGGVRDRAEDVMPPKPPVEGDGFGELRDLGGGTAARSVRCGRREIFYSWLPRGEFAPETLKSHSENSGMFPQKHVAGVTQM